MLCLGSSNRNSQNLSQIFPVLYLNSCHTPTTTFRASCPSSLCSSYSEMQTPMHGPSPRHTALHPNAPPAGRSPGSNRAGKRHGCSAECCVTPSTIHTTYMLAER